MNETSHDLLDLLRSDERTEWIASHLVASFAEGISQSAKDTDVPFQSDFIDEQNLSSKERAKRDKYETSRPYTEEEKLDLAHFALTEVFITLPKMQEASMVWLLELGSQATEIEYRQPDEEEIAEGSYTRYLSQGDRPYDDLSSRLSEFFERVRS